ncbi:MAG: hypothetical protein RLY58_1532 [Pseudomonadota bacterium]|jgi:uncharacterized protein (DUF2147 family)
MIMKACNGLLYAMALSGALSIGSASATPSTVVATPENEPSTTSIEGVWRTIDDRTGFARALVKIQKTPDGQYHGMITRVLPRPDYTPKKTCQNCPKPFTDQPIEGLHLLWNLHEEGSTTKLVGGYIIDPLTGNIYNCKANLSKDGRRLAMRGFTDVSMLGRSQTWIRAAE